MRYSRAVLLVAIAFALSTFSSTAVHARIVKSRSDLSYGPKVVRYDAQKDELIRQESIVSRAHNGRPGGEYSYTGTRLKQYQFHGKQGRGGIYDAIQDYHRELKLDPDRYQYRRRREL